MHLRPYVRGPQCAAKTDFVVFDLSMKVCFVRLADLGWCALFAHQLVVVVKRVNCRSCAR